MYCKDTWTRPIPVEKLAAYRQMIEDGKITDLHVTYNRTTKVTYVEYDSELSHDEVLDEMRKRI